MALPGASLLAGCANGDAPTMPSDAGIEARTDISHALADTGLETAPSLDATLTSAFCGDGVVGPGEECDDANRLAHDGCEQDCLFTCVWGDPLRGDSACDDHSLCNGKERCTVENKCQAGTYEQDTALCGASSWCLLGVCVPNDVSCGDGRVTAPPEECDDGNQIAGDGCDHCRFSCVAGDPSRACFNDNPCLLASSCGEVEHLCAASQQVADGTACGVGLSCRLGTCVDHYCGNGTVEPGEECDDGNVDSNDGCDTCRFSCVSSDPSRSCQADPCKSGGLCDDSTHVCQQATPRPDATPCGDGMYCRAGNCIAAVCGNSVKELGEACDDGNADDADGCKANCSFSCSQDAECKGTKPACQKPSCTAKHVCAFVTDAATEGKSCQTGFVCKSGSCVEKDAVCGNGLLEKGEECDFGGANGSGVGCETNCRFSCSTTNDSCSDGNACNGSESCVDVTLNGQTAHKCTGTSGPADGTTCGSGSICSGGTCQASVCGDGYKDSAAGETCEPPNQGTCDDSCHLVCDVAGSWALHLTVNVTWRGAAGPSVSNDILAGSGKVESWFLVQRAQSGRSIRDDLRLCSTRVPLFQTGYDQHQLTVPTAIFDHSPPYQGSRSISYSVPVLQPGSSYSTPVFAALLGVTMPTPETGPWFPDSSVQADDEDQDALAGVSVPVEVGSGSQYWGIDTYGRVRTDKVYFSLREAASLDGKLDSCTQWSGTARVSHLDTHVNGCHLAYQGGECTAAQRDVLDANRPAYQPSDATFVSKRLSAAATCATVRGAL